MKLQAVIIQVLHLLSHHLHRAVAWLRSIRLDAAVSDGRLRRGQTQLVNLAAI